MDKIVYKEVESYMLSCMNNNDCAHGYQHIYRVLYNALELSKDYEVDKEVLIASALLHDIGRDAQEEESSKNHAAVGAAMAYKYLITIGWSEDKANHVKDCIAKHSHRIDNKTCSIESKLLYDADKLDIIGYIGISRLIAYSGIVAQPLYSVDDNGQVLSGDNDGKNSFFNEYHQSIKKVNNNFYTNQAKKIAENKIKDSIHIYNNLFDEVDKTHKYGLNMLDEVFNNSKI